MHMRKNVVYFSLDISDGVNITDDRDLKGFLATMYNNGKYKTIIRI